MERGDRVVYRGPADKGLVRGNEGQIVSDVPPRMDVSPFATPPTVPEDMEALRVEVDFDDIGRRTVALEDLVVARPR